MEQIFCQSCAMPLNKTEEFGTEKDGAKSQDYCHYCYQNGAFTSEQTMEEMIESCVPFVVDHFGGEDAARAAMQGMFPKLKRWAKA